MASAAENKKLLREINKALEKFPELVKMKKRRYQERQKFLKATFGSLIKQLEKELKKSE